MRSGCGERGVWLVVAFIRPGARGDWGHGGRGGGARFPAEKLRVYGFAVEWQERIERLLPRMHRIKSHLARQLDRAIWWLVLNTAEGTSEHSPAEKRRFYRIALRSGGEAAPALAFFARRMGGLRAELALLSTVMAMLTGLCRGKDR